MREEKKEGSGGRLSLDNINKVWSRPDHKNLYAQNCMLHTKKNRVFNLFVCLLNYRLK